MKRFLFIALAIAISGCGESEREIDAPREIDTPHHNYISTANANPAKPSAATAKSTTEKLMALRKTCDTNAYILAAREYLTANRDDIIAADVLAIYAHERDAENFRAFATQYANGNAANLLEAAEIADNESWPTMCAEFAHSVAKDESVTFGQLFRAAQFIADAPDEHLPESVMQRLEDMAEKQYQREDVALMRCLMNFRRIGLSESDIATLEHLSQQAMMPQVRKRARTILDAQE